MKDIISKNVNQKRLNISSSLLLLEKKKKQIKQAVNGSPTQIHVVDYKSQPKSK